MANNNELIQFMSKAHMSMGGGSMGMPAYTPQYEISYLGIIGMEEMWEDLVNPPDFVKEFMDRFNITREELVDTYNKYIEANKRITGENKSETVLKSLQESGFMDSRLEVRLVIDALFGRAMLGAFWYGVRDKIVEGVKPNKFVGYDKLESMMKRSVYLEEGEHDEG